ncbi:MAG: glutathione peroxidase [Clostridiales bacterium]|jgi:glutathione peroxidase|nr:glutathione peroxidase [Clostridiales bacterium]
MLYDIVVHDNHGNEVALRTYQGKVLLIVNTATQCGLTPQYQQLQKLYDQYREQGLEVLDFPCNQFLEQAPGSDEDIHNFCTSNYQTAFPRFAKVQVNGSQTCPLYQYLKQVKPVDSVNSGTGPFLQKLKELDQVFPGSEIKWNFTKFLIDREGNVVKRYAPNIDPEELKQDIEALL